MTNKTEYEVIIIGAGASGLFCAMHAAYKGLRVLVLEKNAKAGMKILVSGGGHCNFTHLYTDATKHYISQNKYFCISALSRFTPDDFVELVQHHNINFHEKTPGQLFCDNSSKQILQMLLDECNNAQVQIHLNSEVSEIKRVQATNGANFEVTVKGKHYRAAKMVIASGGLSLPKIASDFSFKSAKDFNMSIVKPKAGLVPLMWNDKDKVIYGNLSGISLPANLSCNGQSFCEPVLFTHRGLSGPGILQISSFWHSGDHVTINWLPHLNAEQWLAEQSQLKPQQLLSNILKTELPKRLISLMTAHWFKDQKMCRLSISDTKLLAAQLNNWQFKPVASEGYRTAEVTLGGVDCNEISSKTMESKQIDNLFIIGEAVDVSGFLGGYNFQWAWASGFCCAQHL